MQLRSRPERVHSRVASSSAAVALAVALAILPLLVPAVAIAVRHPTINWAGDRALTELAVREAVRFHQLLGMGGRFGWRHPGPLWIQLLAPLYVATGHAPWSLSVGTMAVHIACAAIAVVAAGHASAAGSGSTAAGHASAAGSGSAAAGRPSEGRGAAPMMAAAIAVYVAATGLVYWTNLWAGYAFTWPMLALVVVAAVAAAAGQRAEGWALPAALLLGTLLVQTDVSMVVPVVFVGVVAIGLRLRRRGWRGPYNRLLLSLTALAWVPPLFQELTTSPGNLTLLWRYATSGSGGYPLRTAVATVGAALSVLPFGARWVLSPGVQAHVGAGPVWAIAWTVGFVAALVWVAVRRARTFAGDLALMTLAATIAAIVAVSRVDGPINFYLLTWMSILPVPGLVAVALAVPAERWHPAAGLATAAVFGLVVIVGQGTDHDWARSDSAAIHAEIAAVTAAAIAPHGLVLVHVVTADAWPLAAGVALQLERNGDAIEVDPSWVFLFGDAFRPTADGRNPHRLPDAELWFAHEHERPAVTDQGQLIDLGTAGNVELFGRANLPPLPSA